MPKWLFRLAQGTSRRHFAKLIRVLHNILRTRTFVQRRNETSLRKHAYLLMAFPHLDHRPSHGRFCR